MQPIIEVENLEKVFGHKKALKGVNLKIYEGDFLSLFGPNGAGKTTLLKSIATIIKPTQGKIHFRGMPVGVDSVFLREAIGLVSHNTLLYDDLTAYENLLFYARMYGVPYYRERIKQLLHQVGLYHRKDDVVRTFSRGMLQRLAIARAILHDPPVLLLDEPYTGLDAQAARILDELLVSLKDGHRTFIMTSHDLGKGFEHASRIAILYSGEVVFDKPKSETSLEEFEGEFWKWVGREELVS
jgi:heme exporter protein A